MGRSVEWGEAIRLASLLRRDPGTWLAASIEGWAHPFSRLNAQVADLWDLNHSAAGFKKPAQYPRPYKTAPTTYQKGDAAGRSPEQMKALLRTQFGQPQAPV